jgi:regulator of cell morphogenesis and NO signaling
MASATQQNAADLIIHILERFHETHRRELPEMLRLGRFLGTRSDPLGLFEGLRVMAEALESHMLKEEMRLFPMMEQGGNALIGHLIDDMQAEHLAHRDMIAHIEYLFGELPASFGAEVELALLQVALAKLFDDLNQHIRIEDDVLFPMFVPEPRAPTSI